jgi:hypothetical protein
MPARIFNVLLKPSLVTRKTDNVTYDLVLSFSGWLGLILSGAWRQGAGTVHPRLNLVGESDAADPSAGQPRRGWTSAPARNSPRQDPLKLRAGPAKLTEGKV